MRMLVFEGSLEEIKELQKEFARSGTATLTVDSPEGDPSSNEEADLTPGRRFVSAEVAFRCLTRRPLSKEQRAVVAAIYHSHPDGILATALQKEIKYTTSEFAGLMGAFGRRLVNTKGYVDYTWFFDNRWEAEHSCNRYRFPESVRQAIVKAKLV